MSEDKNPRPDLSLVLPCYNEEEALELTVPPLIEAFTRAGVDVELILVDNGSKDRTSEVIDRLMDRGLPIIKTAVPVNRGQGLGILTGLRLVRGDVVGWVGADGQVAPQNIVALYQALRSTGSAALAKVARRSRQDGTLRRAISICYNLTMRALFAGVPSFDINANPKIMSAEVFQIMQLSSQDWFLEAETMLKARYLELPVIEIVIPDRSRLGGRSHVRISALLEFLKNILIYRLAGRWRSWMKETKRGYFHSELLQFKRIEHS